jgi:predicted nucleic acid-binding protein
MSLCYLDTNFLLSHLRQSTKDAEPRLAAWRQAVISEVGSDRPVISALVLDEVIYRSTVSWLKEDGDRDPITSYRRSTRDVMERLGPRLRGLWQAVDSMDLEVVTTDDEVISRARQLMDEAYLGSRDAFHAAHAIDRGCDWIVSGDPDFDVLSEIDRLGPDHPTLVSP